VGASLQRRSLRFGDALEFGDGQFACELFGDGQFACELFGDGQFACSCLSLFINRHIIKIKAVQLYERRSGQC